MVMHNFYLTELIGGFLNPVQNPETEWIYAYSQNKTLLDMSLNDLKKVPDLKMHYLQLDSTHRCMPAGGALAFDTHMTYTFINLMGYGHQNSSGYLKSLLRDDDPLEIDLATDFSKLGSRGDGIWGHFKSKAYLMFDCLCDLTYMMLLVLISCKVFIHAIAKIQTKQMFARHTNLPPNLTANSEGQNQQNANNGLPGNDAALPNFVR
mmetsp:Transcript_25114/g.33672  ORF Transcript_25114/g.33672 Transcript_25114/m.33672 type:complete len:207 (-) Transcript_25114:1635-2255(-)